MKYRILIVDDNSEAADALGKLVGMLGYEARVVYSGVDAIEAAQSLEPDMAFIDIGMPGLDGYATVQAIRKHDSRHVILVALTGYAAKVDKDKAYAAGFDLHVAKPLGMDTLNELLALVDPTSPAVVEIGTVHWFEGEMDLE